VPLLRPPIPLTPFHVSLPLPRNRQALWVTSAPVQAQSTRRFVPPRRLSIRSLFAMVRQSYQRPNYFWPTLGESLFFYPDATGLIVRQPNRAALTLFLATTDAVRSSSQNIPAALPNEFTFCRPSYPQVCRQSQASSRRRRHNIHGSESHTC
jgi:hypothetical protein